MEPSPGPGGNMLVMSTHKSSHRRMAMLARMPSILMAAVASVPANGAGRNCRRRCEVGSGAPDSHRRGDGISHFRGADFSGVGGVAEDVSGAQPMVERLPHRSLDARGLLFQA